VRVAGESEDRAAFYALSPGGWRDYWTLLHPPYTLWHLSYVAIGAVLATTLRLEWLGETLLAFFLAMGVGAHALDELHGRPLGTRISDRMLISLAVIGLGGAAVIGVHGVIVGTPWLGVFIAVGGYLVIAYNLELFRGAFHSDLWFALAWGGFPVVTAYLAQTGRVSAAAAVAAAGCTAISAAQRALSTPVRRMRRDVAGVEGLVRLRDGTTERLDSGMIRDAPERALRLLSLAMPLVGLALVVAKVFPRR
jgi:hypothetical protein